MLEGVLEGVLESKRTFKDLDFPSFNRLDVTLERRTRSSNTTIFLTNFIFLYCFFENLSFKKIQHTIKILECV